MTVVTGDCGSARRLDNGATSRDCRKNRDVTRACALQRLAMADGN